MGATTNKKPVCYKCGHEKKILKAFAFGSGKNYVEFMREEEDRGATILWFCNEIDCEYKGIITLF